MPSRQSGMKQRCLQEPLFGLMQEHELAWCRWFRLEAGIGFDQPGRAAEVVRGGRAEGAAIQ